MTTTHAPDRPPTDVIEVIRSVTAAQPKRARHGIFSLTTSSPGELALAPFVGLYLGYAVVRIPEVFEQDAD